MQNPPKRVGSARNVQSPADRFCLRWQDGTAVELVFNAGVVRIW
jgi:hypothetical protein